MKADVFSKGMAMLRVSYPQSKIQADSLTMDVWFEALKDLADDDYIFAIKSCVQNNKFFPSIAEIREKATGASQQDIEGNALNAWQKVKIGIRRAGYMRSVKFDDQIIHNVLQIMGGWKNFCWFDEEEERFYRPQFLKSYAACSRLQAQGKLQNIPYLPGEAETHNLGHGHTQGVESPMEITDETVRQSLEYNPPLRKALPENPADVFPPDEAKGIIKSLINMITEREVE